MTNVGGGYLEWEADISSGRRISQVEDGYLEWKADILRVHRDRTTGIGETVLYLYGWERKREHAHVTNTGPPCPQSHVYHKSNCAHILPQA
eukprot:CAMPEP_0119351890 /NCGR_PEP_ID=MMETSP1334-20130426/1170_1 /TAXON_ID=127549 /ORGANISM="Calcidiscus leptoporus, Strain RCC1130" /LENGTH=90 /DNA_ID=CAMNT_0007364789 /DNA_START=142 /DNA_END=414 /DNA_ORIENTATION=-